MGAGAATLVSIAALAAVGCSGDGQPKTLPTSPVTLSETPAPTTSSPTTQPTTPSSTMPARSATAAADGTGSDAPLAGAMLLDAAEFPDDWTESAAPEFDLRNEPAALCFGDYAPFIVGDHDAESSLFSSPDGRTEVRQAIEVFESEQIAAAMIDHLIALDVPTCLQARLIERMEAQLQDPTSVPPDTALLGIEVARISSMGDLALRSVITIESDGEQIAIFNDYVFVRSGRAISMQRFYSAGEPVSLDDFDAWVFTAAMRMGEAVNLSTAGDGADG